MKRQKIMALVIALLTAVSLCGCNNDDQSTDSTENGSSTAGSSSGISQTQSQVTDSSPDSDHEQHGETSSDTSKVKEPLEFFGALNEPIDRSEIVKADRTVYNSETERRETTDIPLDEMDESEYFTAYTGFAYYAMPLYPCLTSLDSEYDEVNNVFKDVPQEKKNDLLRAKKGDKLFDMTVTDAYSSFYIGDSGGKHSVSETHLSLEGELTLSGYARVVPGDEYGYNTGEIIFRPIGESRLPIVNFEYNYEDKSVTRSIGSVGIVDDIFITNEYPGDFTLGSINDTTADISCLTRDGSYTKVSVTISGIEMNSNFNWFSDYVATIKSIDRID